MLKSENGTAGLCLSTINFENTFCSNLEVQITSHSSFLCSRQLCHQWVGLSKVVFEYEGVTNPQVLFLPSWATFLAAKHSEVLQHPQTTSHLAGTRRDEISRWECGEKMKEFLTSEFQDRNCSVWISFTFFQSHYLKFVCGRQSF